MSHQSILRLPPLVTVNQMQGGQLRFHYSGDSVVALQAALIAFAGSLLETAIAAVQAKKNAELDRQQMPASRLETIDQELAALQGRRAEVLAQMAAAPPSTPPGPPLTVEDAMAAAVLAAQSIPLPPPPPAPPAVDPLAHPGLAQVPAGVATPPAAPTPGVPQYYVMPSAAPAPAVPTPVRTVQAPPVIVPTTVTPIPLGP